ncbi:MAG: hypothetical protein ACI9DQ_001871, partial [Glaciecola sp.]
RYSEKFADGPSFSSVNTKERIEIHSY